MTDPSNGQTFNYAITPYLVDSPTADWSQAVAGPWALAVADAAGYDREAYPAAHDWLNADVCHTVQDGQWVDRACIRRDLGLTAEDSNRLMLPDLIVRRSVMTGCSTVDNGGSETLLIAPFGVSNLGQGPLEILAAAGNPNGFQVIRKRLSGSAAQFVGAWQNFGTVAPWFAVADDTISARLVDDSGAIVASSEQPLCAVDAAVADPVLLPGGALELGGLQHIADTFYGGDVDPFASADCGVLATQGLSVAHSVGGTAILDVSSLPDGDYTLEIGVNESGPFVERSTANNVTTIAISYEAGEITSGCESGAPAIDSPGLF